MSVRLPQEDMQTRWIIKHENRNCAGGNRWTSLGDYWRIVIYGSVPSYGRECDEASEYLDEPSTSLHKKGKKKCLLLRGNRFITVGKGRRLSPWSAQKHGRSCPRGQSPSSPGWAWCHKVVCCNTSCGNCAVHRRKRGCYLRVDQNTNNQGRPMIYFAGHCVMWSDAQTASFIPDMFWFLPQPFDCPFLFVHKTLAPSGDLTVSNSPENVGDTK